MKRLFLVLILITVAFVFFSFLSKTDIRIDRSLTVFFDNSLPNNQIIMEEVTKRLENEGFSVTNHYFNPTDISSYIMSHPEALFVTYKQVEPKLYSLQGFDLFLVKVAVIKKDIDYRGVEGEKFDEAIKVKNGPFRVISYQDLNFGIKPLTVDGVFPSLYNIKNGIYPKIYRAKIYVKDSDILQKPRYHMLRYHLGDWINYSFSVIAGGDIMLARGTKKYVERFGPRYPFTEIESEIKKYDVAFANLESPISFRGKPFSPFKGIYFRADPAVIDGLKFSGFDVLSLANNHALDWGVEAISDTMRLIRENGMKYTGVGQSRKEALRPAVLQINGTSIAFISYNDIYPFIVKEDGKTMLTLTIKDDSLESDIGFLKERYDIVVVSVHTGIEYLAHPEKDKVMLMRKLIDCGADVVLGSHPHVIQDIEVYRNGIIAYSLGNLIFDQNWSEATSMGLLLEIAFIGKNPIYFYPHVVNIRKAQAHIIQKIDLKSILTSINFERREYAYKQD